MIVEPVQAEGGDRHASNSFFRRLRDMALAYDVPFIADEVQTGFGATGDVLWAHERWELDTPPDFVTFAKKAQCAGFFYRRGGDENGFNVREPYRIFNTYLGALEKVLLMDAIHKVVVRERLLHRVTATGSFIVDGLESLGSDFPGRISNVRGIGTFIAFDAADDADRQRIFQGLKAHQVLVGMCGDVSIRLRPALTLTEEEGSLFLDALRFVLAETEKKE